MPQDVPAHMKLMLDLVVLAFQMDKTRVATLMLNNDLSQMNFKFVEGVQGALHLDLTHNGRVAEKEAMYLKTNQFHAAQFAYLTSRMKAVSEGETTLLDSSILLFASSLFDGDLHGAEQLPILLTGKGGGSLRTGRILDYLDRGDENRKACSLHLSLMDRMGVKARPLRRRDHAAGRPVGGAFANAKEKGPAFRPAPSNVSRSVGYQMSRAPSCAWRGAPRPLAIVPSKFEHRGSWSAAPAGSSS
jgi:hypothetical protein